jgi:hypothetical protein
MTREPTQNPAMSASPLATPNQPTLTEPTMAMTTRSHHDDYELGAMTILLRALSQYYKFLRYKTKEKKMYIYREGEGTRRMEKKKKKKKENTISGKGVNPWL